MRASYQFFSPQYQTEKLYRPRDQPTKSSLSISFGSVPPSYVRGKRSQQLEIWEAISRGPVVCASSDADSVKFFSCLGGPLRCARTKKAMPCHVGWLQSFFSRKKKRLIFFLTTEEAQQNDITGAGPTRCADSNATRINVRILNRTISQTNKIHII
jgi:hypothetical protein